MASERARRVRTWARVVVVVTGAALALWGFVIEPSRLIVRRVALQIPQLPPLRIAVISDLHAGANFIDREKVQRVVAETNALGADLIVLLGDYLNNGANPDTNRTPEVGGYLDPALVATDLGELRARHGVYAVLGNHDWWLDGERIATLLGAQQIRVLEDEATAIDLAGTPLYLVGLGDFSTRTPHVARVLATLPAGAAIVALTHSPDLFPEIPSRVALTLAGHTHGGQVAIPLLGRPIVPLLRTRYTHGHIEEHGHHLYVTTGIGTSLVPVRLGNPPEIVLLTIRQ